MTADDFEWDDAKAETNLEKHGVSFDEAIVALHDPCSIETSDPAHPERVLTLGLNPSTGVLYVVWTEGSAERARIISARKATSREERRYQKGR